MSYVQDDIRVNNTLTLNAGLRYEYATPMWEASNDLTNFDPVTKTMIAAKDGSIYDRTLVNPDRNNFGPRLGFAYTPMSKTVVRAGWGISYVHVNRIGSANLLGINGPQVVRAAVNQTPTTPGFIPTEQGFPAGITAPSAFNPLTALVSYIPSDFHSSPVQSWHVSVQREFRPNMLIDAAYVGNKATDLLSSATTTRRRRTTRRGRFRWRRGGRSRPGATSRMCSTAASPLRRLPVEIRMAAGRRRQHPQLADAVAGAGQRRDRSKTRTATSRRRRTSTTSLPSTASPATTSRTTRRPASCGSCRSARASVSGSMSSAMDLLVGGWQLAGINTVTPGEMVTLTYTPAAAFQVSGSRTTSPAPTTTGRTSPAIHGGGRPADDQQLVQHRVRGDSHGPGQPFGNAPRNNVRGPGFWRSMPRRARTSRSADGPLAPARGVQPLQPCQFPGAGEQPQRRHVRHDRYLRRTPGAARREVLW